MPRPLDDTAVAQPGHTVLASAATGAAAFIADLGGDPFRIVEECGINPEALGDPTHAVGLGAYCLLFERAAAQTRQGNLGLHYGQQFQPRMLGLIGYIALASPTILAAAENLARYFPMHQTATRTRLIRHGAFFHLEYQILNPDIAERRQDAELTMGMFCNVFRHALGRKWCPEEIHLEHPRPEATREHVNAFQAPVHFGQRTNAVVFRDSGLDQKMPEADPQLLAVLCASLSRLHAGVSPVGLLDQIRTEIRNRMPSGTPTLEAIGDSLQIPRRTLQRRLDDQNTSFSSLVDLVRKETALRHLHQQHLSIEEISHLLGYSDISAFSRAFRNWLGVPPSRYRRDIA